MLVLLTKFIHQRLLICLFFLLVVFGGIYAFRTIPIDAFPDLTNNQVQILTETPGMAPIEAEQLVTIPIESLMNGLPKIKQIRSISKFGISVVTVVFDDNVNVYFARQQVSERLQNAKSRLPVGVNPEMGPITTGMGEIYQYVVDGNGYNATELKTLHDWDIKYQLRTVPGVNEVNTWGGLTLEYQVVISPEALQQHGLTIQEVLSALKENNTNFNGGIVINNAEQYVVQGLGRVNGNSDIESILIKKQGDTPISLGQVATVAQGAALRQGAATKDGLGEVVTGIVMMLKGENSREVISEVKKKIKTIQKSLPESVRIRPFYDQTHLVEQTVQTVESNLLEGGILVIAVLLLLLGNVRAALITAAVIPISLMFSFMGMKAMGISANIMSLGALDFGMIVDGAIVMVENIIRRLSHNAEESLSVSTVVELSLKEMAKPIFFGILIITVVYLPILTLEGMEYKMFAPMVFTVCFALIGSLITALTLVPVLCTFFFKPNLKEKENKLIANIKPRYLSLLDRALKSPKPILITACICFVLAVGSLAFIGSEFVPELDEGDFVITAVGIPSIALPEAIKNITEIEKVVKTFPEIKTVVSKTGRPDLATDPMSVNSTDMYVILKPKDKWRFGWDKQHLVDSLREQLNKQFSGYNFSFTQPIAMRVDELVSGVRSDVAIKLFGDDMTTLTSKANEIEALMQKIQGTRDVQVEKSFGNKQITILPNRQLMAHYGVTVEDMKNVIETAIMGTAATEVIDGRKRYAVRLKFPANQFVSPEQVSQILIETSTAKQRVPLGQVAVVKASEGLDVINREAGQRRVIVQCNVKGRDIASFVAEGKQLIEKNVKLPTGYFIQWGGQFENQQRAMNKLLLVVPASILIIFFLLMATFSSVRQSLLVLLNVPFALIGGIISLWLRGFYLSVPACVGFIALFGVAVLNGLVMISAMNQARQNGLPLTEAIKQGAETRLRPVLMTALVAILGFLPMAVSQGAGAEIQKPLATVVIGGILTSTILTLFILPILYSKVTDKGLPRIFNYS